MKLRKVILGSWYTPRLRGQVTGIKAMFMLVHLLSTHLQLVGYIMHHLGV